MLPKVSIVIPVYNAASILECSITELLKQTYDNIELILVDDSSADESYELAKKLKSDKVKIFKQPNSGAAIARNTGFQHSNGEYIQFMDIDDFLSYDKIEKQVLALLGHEDKVAVCNYISFFNESDLPDITLKHDQDPFIFSTNDPVNFLLNLFGANGSSNFIQTNCWLVPRSLIDKVGGWRNYRCPDDDGEFFSRVLLASTGVIYVPGVYNFYRRSVNNDVLSQNKGYLYLRNTLLTIDLKRSYLSKYTSGELLDRAIAKQYLDFAVSTYLHNDLLSAVAYKKFKELNVDVPLPKIGGKTIENLRRMFGWKVAKQIKFIINKLI